MSSGNVFGVAVYAGFDFRICLIASVTIHLKHYAGICLCI